MSDSNRNDRDTETASETAEDRVRSPSDDIDSGTGVGDRDHPGRDRRDDSTRVANEERRRKVPVFSAVIALIGAWVALSVLLYDVSQAAFWNNVLVGAAVFLAAGYNYYRVNNDQGLSVGVSGLVALLGIWLIIAPALFEMSAGAGLTDSPFWSTLGSGVLVAALAGYNAYDAREAQRVATDSRRA